MLNNRDQSKWDSLQDSGGKAIDKILTGKATDADIKQLSETLAQQHELAGQIFDRSVEEAQTTADTIVDQMNKRRLDEGKKALTGRAHDRIFKHTFQQVMSESLENILGMIHDEFEQSSKETRDKIGEALDRLQSSVKAREPEANNQAAPQPQPLFNRFVQPQPAPAGPAAPTEVQKRSLWDRMLGRGKERDAGGPRTSIIQGLRETVKGAKDKLGDMYAQFRNRGKNDERDEDKAASIWIRRLKAVFDPAKSIYKKARKGASSVRSLLGMVGKPLLLALMNPQLIKSITSAVSEYLSFDKISNFVSNMWDDTKKFASDTFDDAMAKVKAFFGTGKDKEKAKNGPAVQAAQPVKAAAAVANNTTPQQAAAVLPQLAQKIESAKAKVDAAQRQYATAPTADNKKVLEDAKTQLGVLNVQYTQYAYRARSAPTTSPADKAQTMVAPASTAPTVAPGEGQPMTTPPTGPVKAGTDVPQTKTTLTAADPTAVLSKSSAAAPQQKTEVIGDMPVYRSGRPYDSPDKKAAEQAAAVKQGAATAQIGLGSFGFDSNDSSLNILNMGMLS